MKVIERLSLKDIQREREKLREKERVWGGWDGEEKDCLYMGMKYRKKKRKEWKLFAQEK